MNRSVKSYRDLEVWQKGVVLTKNIYQATGGFPAEEKFGLVSQMRRAAFIRPYHAGPKPETISQALRSNSLAQAQVPSPNMI
jgi:23S rRNA-intervening sequence protein